MSKVSAVEDPERTKPLVQYTPSDAAIAELKTQLGGLKADTPVGYELVRQGIAQTRNFRVAIEKRRVELKADALAWGRKVDSEAHRLTDLLLEIETPLKLEKQKIDEEKERTRREAEEAEKAKIAAAEKARLKEILDAEEKRLRVERERLAAERAKMEEKRKADEWELMAERERIAKEQAAEAARLKDEQDALAEQRRKEEVKQQQEREKLRAERAAAEEEQRRIAKVQIAEASRLAAERQRLERIEFERQAKEAEAEAAEVERQRIEAAKPDIKKIHGFGEAIRALPRPVVIDSTAAKFVAQIDLALRVIATDCEAFTLKKGRVNSQ